MPTVATGIRRSPAPSSARTRPTSTPSVAVAVRTASRSSASRSWLSSANRPNPATAFCWSARRARCAEARARSLTSRATTSRDSIVPSSARTGTAWTAKVTSPLENSKVRRSPRSARPVVLEAELQHLVGDLGVELGHEAAAEHVLVEEAEPADRLALGDEDPQLGVEQEDVVSGRFAVRVRCNASEWRISRSASSSSLSRALRSVTSRAAK